jgi:hypothetical protein
LSAGRREKEKEKKEREEGTAGLLGRFGSGLAQLAPSTFFLFKPFPFILLFSALAFFDF